MKRIIVGICLVLVVASSSFAQTRPPPQQQQKPESVALAMALLGNALQDLFARHEAELATLRTSWQNSVASAAASEAWWHDCVRQKTCLEWATSAPTGQPGQPSSVAPFKGEK